VIAIAARDQAVRQERRRSPLRPTAYTSGRGRWQVSWFANGKEKVQVLVSDGRGRVTESWTGPQVAWKMARGYPGAFGRKVNSPWVWIPLCVLFVVPFVDPRRPWRLLHLDLLVLLAFGASHVFFNRGEVDLSMPLAYPPLLYLAARLLVAGLRPRPVSGALVPVVPLAWLAIAAVFLLGFRITLNVLDSNVIDVGYAGVIGADRIADGEVLYDGRFPADNQRGDTYGPATYLAYVPFEQALPWSGRWDDLPAAHAAAVAFDLLVLIGLIVLALRLRPGPDGRSLAVVLAYAWLAYPYSLFAMASNSNDALVGAVAVWCLVLLARPACSLTRAAAAGALAGVLALTKFAPVVVVPALARRLRDAMPVSARRRSLVAFVLAFAAALTAFLTAFLPPGGPQALWERTLGYQGARDSPFSPWSSGVIEAAWPAALALAAAFALAPVLARGEVTTRRTAAFAAAALVGVQLAATHWSYLYVVWFAPLVLVALFEAHPRVTPRRARAS